MSLFRGLEHSNKNGLPIHLCLGYPTLSTFSSAPCCPGQFSLSMDLSILGIFSVCNVSYITKTIVKLITIYVVNLIFGKFPIIN